VFGVVSILMVESNGMLVLQNMVLLNIGLAEHCADWNYADIKSPFARLYYVTDGFATVRTLDQTIELKPNYLYLIPPFTLHSDNCSGYFRLYYMHVYFKPANGLGLFEQYQMPYEVVASEADLPIVERIAYINPNRELQRYDPKWYDNSANLLQNLSFSSHTAVGASVETMGLLMQLLSHFLNHAQPKLLSTDSRVLSALTFIHQNIHQPIDIASLASSAYLSTDHFIRLFKREVGCTPMNYVHDKKIEQAQTMLLFTSLSVKEIAWGLAFNNLSYFGRLFKTITGLTPFDYRQRANAESV
jgi:AraC-like DNA-binding protein